MISEIQINNWVKIYREPTRQEFENWNGVWTSSHDESVGQYFKVLELDKNFGVKIQLKIGKCWVPICVLENWSKWT